MAFLIAALLALSLTVLAQQRGSLTPENHPPLSIQECTKAAGCTQEQKEVTVDGNWRWTHQVGGSKNCYTGDEWDTSICPDPQSCAKNCALDGADYAGTYGVHSNGNQLQLGFVTHGPYSTNIGSRLFLMEDTSTYKLFKLKNREFTFTADVSQLPCGLNGALYFVAMAADGGASQYPGDAAGAEYGTGYCDAQCPHDIKFINGEANLLNWTKSPDDPNSGTGLYGTCCTEMDIWESNSMAHAVTPHVCTISGQHRCSGKECGDDSKGEREVGECDKDGCDFNPYRQGNQTFFGVGASFAIDSSQPFTVVTQFITNDNTDTGTLVAIRRLYRQGGRTVPLPTVSVGGSAFNSVTDSYCSAQKKAFGDTDGFEQRGGLRALGADLEKGMVLVMSLWDDHAAHMLWLDSSYPVGKSGPGVLRGPCGTDTGVPSQVEAQHPDAYVRYSDIRFGEIGTTL